MQGLAENVISPTGATVGRPRINHDKMAARFPAGTFAAIDTVLNGRDRSDWLREAVAEKLARESKPGTDCADSRDQVNRG